MKTDTHPQYFPNAQIKCACGNVIKVGSTKEKIEIEICSNCHPFYTGKAKLIDTAGRVEKFKARQAKASTEPSSAKKARKKSQTGK
ncbi:50S ribosomal protein L31 [Candidatus Giovannonibacteria bacterium]|nr:50S ribosomal protein L31 [Candidatus Giovannonibacteria bacterium]